MCIFSDITPLCPCSANNQDTDSLTTTAELVVGTITSVISAAIQNSHSRNSASPNLLVTTNVISALNNQSQTTTVKTNAVTGKQTNVDAINTHLAMKTQTASPKNKPDMPSLNTSVNTDPEDNLTKKITKPPDVLTQKPSTIFSLTISQVSTWQKTNNSTTRNDSKTTVRPGVKAVNLNTIQLNNDHIGNANKNVSKLNMSEKIDHVPGANGAISVGEIIDRVILRSSRTKVTTAIIETKPQSTSTPITRYCNDQDDDFPDVGAHLGDLVLVHGINGPKATNFSNLLDHVLGHKIDLTTKKPCIPQIPINSGKKSTDFENQVKEVKFQVSPDVNNVRINYVIFFCL